MLELNEEAGLPNLTMPSVCKGTLSRLETPGGKSSYGHFQHILLTSAPSPEAGLAIPLNLTWGRRCRSYGSEALRSLTWLCPHQQHTFPWDVIYFLHSTTLWEVSPTTISMAGLCMWQLRGQQREEPCSVGALGDNVTQG